MQPRQLQQGLPLALYMPPQSTHTTPQIGKRFLTHPTPMCLANTKAANHLPQPGNLHALLTGVQRPDRQRIPPNQCTASLPPSYRNASLPGPTPRDSASSGAIGRRMRMATRMATVVAVARPSPAGVTLSLMYFSAVRWQIKTYLQAIKSMTMHQAGTISSLDRLKCSASRAGIVTAQRGCMDAC